MSIEESLQEPLLGRLSISPEPEPALNSTMSSKRKRGAGIEQVAKNAAKKTKKTKTKKVYTVDEGELDVAAGINNAFLHMDNQLLADYVAQRTRKYESDLSSVELEDKYIPGRCSQTRRSSCI